MSRASEYTEIKELGRRVGRRREELGLDQETLAERAGVSRPYVSELERGRVPSPKLGDLEGVAGALNCSVGDLLARPSGVATELRSALADLFGPDRADEAEAALREIARKPERDQKLILRLIRLQASSVWLDGGGQSSENGNA